MKQAFNNGFADISVSKRKIKQAFFHQINTIINWDIIALKLDRLYAKGQSHGVWFVLKRQGMCAWRKQISQHFIEVFAFNLYKNFKMICNNTFQI